MTPRVVPFGDAAVLASVAGADGDGRAMAALAAATAAWAEGRPGWGPVIPAAETVLVRVDPVAPGAEAAASELAAELARALSAGATAAPDAPGAALPVLQLPVAYGGADGPDLAWVAERTGLAPEAVVERHAAGLYAVRFLGFSPGFGYLGGLDAALAVPRLDVPRVRVAAGSVAIAGAMTAVYPTASPGGWRLLGRTDVRLWDPAADPPTPLVPGRRVRFVPAAVRW